MSLMRVLFGSRIGSDPRLHLCSQARQIHHLLAMQQFDRDAAAFDRLVAEGDIGQAVKLGLQICRHNEKHNDKPEEASLRDARADLLTRCVLLAQTADPDEHTYARLYALLAKRVFSWLCDGDPFEASLCAGPLPYGAALDTGFDGKSPMTIDDFMECIAGCRVPGAQRSLAQERYEWLGVMADAVGREIWNRIQTILEDKLLRVGCRVVASGLRRTQYNDLRGTLLRRQGQRWGVIFDGVREPKALRPENLDVAPLPAWRFHPLPMPPTGEDYVRRDGPTSVQERCEICPDGGFEELAVDASEPGRVERYRRHLLHRGCTHCQQWCRDG